MTKLLRDVVVWLSLGAGLLASGFSHARIDITPAALTETLNWVGTSITRNTDFCVLSVQEPQASGTTVLPYDVTAAAATAQFELVSGANSIPVSLSWQDLRTSQTVSLSPGISTAQTNTGDTSGCPGGNNGRLILSVNNADIVAAVPGTYSGQMDIDVSNAGAGRSRFRARVTYELVVPDSIRVTQLNDVNLGTFDGVTDVSMTESLCVFRRSGGTYAVVLTGSGAGGAFHLTNGPSAIPYTVTWNDGGGAVTATAGAAIPGRTNSYTLDEYCAGGAANNAALGVQVLANDILSLASTTGIHTGVLTITVQPE